MKKNPSWKFLDELSITFQSSVIGAGEFGHRRSVSGSDSSLIFSTQVNHGRFWLDLTSIIIFFQLWVTGGGKDNARKTTEWVDSNGATPGPSLPWSFHLHCVAKMNTTHYILIGGQDNPKQTLITAFDPAFDLTRSENNNKILWTIGPELRGNGRSSHACAHIRHRNGSNYVIAVGGQNIKDKITLDTTEILNADDPSNGWTEGEINQLNSCLW